MRKILLLPFVLMTALAVQAGVNHLRVEMLSGSELTSALAQIGKIVLGEDDILLYDRSGAQIGSSPYSQLNKIVFYDDGSMAGINDVADPSLQVFYDATRESLFVRGMEGQQTVRVYSVNGQMIQSANAENGEAIMHVGGLQNGTYLLQVGAQIVKFIKD